MNTTDQVNHPSHYLSHPSGVECIRIAEGFNYNLGNAIKYIWRCDSKGKAIEDLQKAVTYLNREIDRRIDAENTAPVVTKSVSSPPAAEIDARLADIRTLAAGGDRSAQLYLSDCYRHGWYGLLVSPEMSKMWRNRANEPRTEKEEQR